MEKGLLTPCEEKADIVAEVPVSKSSRSRKDSLRRQF